MSELKQPVDFRMGSGSSGHEAPQKPCVQPPRALHRLAEYPSPSTETGKKTLAKGAVEGQVAVDQGVAHPTG
jgi:hypothetical protein